MKFKFCTRFGSLGLLSAVLVSSCAWTGDTGSVKRASELAINCDTDGALAALDQAQLGGGLGNYLAGLQRVGILRDAGRSAEASRALDDYMALPEVGSSSPEDIEKSLAEFIEELRKERLERTGSAICN